MKSELARLLEAHVQHELSRLRGPELAQTVGELVGQLFRWFATVKLDDVVTRQQIEAVIERYVIELRVSGGITELSGELSGLVFRSRVTADTRVDEILAPASYEDIAEKLIALDGVRRKLIQLIAQSATFASINARMLVRSGLDLLVPQLALGRARAALPWVELVERMSERVAPGLEQQVADALARYVEARRDWVRIAIENHLLSVLNPERLRSLLDEVWDAVAPMRLSEAFAVMGEQDIEDFVVLIFEFWQRYRKTEFFRRISSEMVDHFFVKYGQLTLAAIIDDMGVNERMVCDELLRFLQPILAQAQASGALAQLLRSRLEPFYASPEAEQAVTVD